MYVLYVKDTVWTKSKLNVSQKILKIKFIDIHYTGIMLSQLNADSATVAIRIL